MPAAPDLTPAPPEWAEDVPPASTPRLGRVILIAVAFGIAVSVALTVTSDAGEVGDAFGDVAPAWFLAAVAAALIANGVKFARWHWYLRRVTLPTDRVVGLRESAAIFMSGVLMLLTPGHVGEFVKSYYASSDGGPAAARTAPIVIAERATNMLGLVIVSLTGGFAYRQAAWVVGVSAAIAFLILATMKSRRVAAFVTHVVERIPLVRRVVPQAEDFTDAASALLTWRSIPVMSMVAAVSWSLEALAYVMVLRAFGVEWSSEVLNSATFTWAVATLAGGLLLTPGGLGVLEGGVTGISLTLIESLDRGAATAAALLARVATLWLPAVIGAACALWLTRRRV
ncbi:MAG: flippase-like domain-containing protein [Dehalococcoidia bacterium]|nr:flippase-like domain-containing protein [Dehalococcoidia bacterium]